MPPRPKETDNEERDEKSNEEKTKRDERAGLPNSLKKQPNRGSYLSTSARATVRVARKEVEGEGTPTETIPAKSRPTETIPAARTSNEFGMHAKRTSYPSSSTRTTVRVARKEVSGEDKPTETIPAARISSAYEKYSKRTSYSSSSAPATVRVAGKKVSRENKPTETIPATRMSSAYEKYSKRTSYLSSSAPATVRVAGKEVAGEGKPAKTIATTITGSKVRVEGRSVEAANISESKPDEKARLPSAFKTQPNRSSHMSSSATVNAIPTKNGEAERPGKEKRTATSKPLATTPATVAGDEHSIEGGRPSRERATAANGSGSDPGKMSVAERARWLDGAFKK